MRAFRDGIKGKGAVTMTKSTLVRAAYGSDAKTEIASQSREIHLALGGDKGLFFTNLSLDEAKAELELYRKADFIKPGQISTETISVGIGPLYAIGDPEGKGAVVRSDGTVVKTQPLNSQTIISYLRKLGIMCELRDCVIYILKPFTICEEGKPVEPKGCRLLRLLGQPGAAGGEFRIDIIGSYERGVGVKSFK
eukprot:gnl/Chilomastix_caulleri/577.p1 GENE.gnl/Chilomastix_caulleri/577~~gnl/Chilomastix_caulleri/577.p1  ORF type:complete len:194 (+),score=45.36 gnl/Chilomastix_caulleri/577:192-773(+)